MFDGSFWAEFDIKEASLSPRSFPLVASIGNNEILIVGGQDANFNYLGDGYILKLDEKKCELVLADSHSSS